MQITKDNIGDVLCLYQTAKHIRILDVGPKYVDYATESGYHYATTEHSADAFAVTDASRLAMFDENYRLGKALNAAEYKAFVLMFDDQKEEALEAGEVLSAVRAQQKHFSDRLYIDKENAVPGKDLADRFLAQLSECSSGSHDMFWGHKVQLLSNWSYEFEIDGKTMDYEKAKEHLSKVRFAAPERKTSLNDRINAANVRKGGEPSLHSGQEHFR